MAKQYWIGDYFVDLSRNQIRKESEPQTLPPKALLVLTKLAENPGQVVSYDELLDAVWPDTVVTPNTLQRSIAQLRKAFNESGKAFSEDGEALSGNRKALSGNREALSENREPQDIIKTHSKQGYSLESEVKWQALESASSSSHLAPENQAQSLQNNSSSNASNIKLLAGVLAVVIVAVVMLVLTSGSETPTMVQGEMRYITATDDKEFDANWSADGRYILFNRYPEKLCINNLWAKDAQTREEFQLTKELGTYVHHSLSPDSQNLVYINQENCEQPVDQNICYRLMSLDFQAALQEPQTGRELLSCENSAIQKPVWVDEQHIVMMQKDAQIWRLVRYSITDASTSGFYQVENGTIQTYRWSAEKQQFAVSALRENGEYYIDMLDASGQLLSSHPVTLAAESPKFMRLRPTFIPDSDKLLFTDRKDLYTLSTQGQVQLQNFNFENVVGSPVFHPNGDRLLLVTGRYDSDITRLAIAYMTQNDGGENGRINSTDNSQSQFEVLQRSNAHEDNAKFQPGGEHIAFISERTGNEQLWLTTAETLSQPQMLSALPEGSYVGNIEWNQQGTGVMVLANSELYQVSLQGEQQKYEADYPVLDLFYWDETQQHVIANISIAGLMKFVKIDLKTMDYQLINDKIVNWAVKKPDGPLVFLDHLHRFWQQTPLEDRLLPQLNDKTKRKARFVMYQQTIYSIDKQEQLWSYNLETREFATLGNALYQADYLTDASKDELLFTFVIAAKKEIVELEVGR